MCTASIALFTDLEIILEMISIGTLLVFYLVANALIYRRYVVIGSNQPFTTLLFLLLLTSSSVGFSMSWKLRGQWLSLALFGGASIIMTSFYQYMVPYIRSPLEWSLPFMPWPAASSIFLNVFLMTTFKKRSYIRFAIWACLVTLFYILYGVHSTYSAEETEKCVDDVNQNISTQPNKIEIQMV